MEEVIDDGTVERSPARLRYDRAKERAQERIRGIIEKEFSAAGTLENARKVFGNIVLLVRAVALLNDHEDNDWEDEWPYAEYCEAPPTDDERVSAEDDDGQDGDDEERETTLAEDFETMIAPFLVLQMPGEAKEALYDYLGDIGVLPSADSDDGEEEGA